MLTIRRYPALIALAVLAGCPNGRATSPTNGPTPAVIAHRGSSYSAPEHTFAAYDLAVAEGADYIEQDIHRTSDGVLVVIHDATLDRTARGDPVACAGSVSEKTVAQIRSCDAGSWFNSLHPDRARAEYVGMKIPTLAEVIERYGSRARYYIEMKDPDKYPGIETQLMALLVKHGLTVAVEGRPRVIVQSFDAASLKRFNALDPRLTVIQLVGQQSSAETVAMLDGIMRYASGIGPHRAGVDRSLVDAALRKGFMVHPYTVDDPAEMKTLLDIRVSGMFTNRPGMLREVIANR